MIRRWLTLTYYLYALRLAALPHFYFNPLYNKAFHPLPKAKHGRLPRSRSPAAEHR